MPSVLPPVRIFLGTEPAQHRAERVFVWSIERVRDPSRIYEIHLMKQLPGFEDRTWTTGFTNYRFAIPSFAGCGGRAIYNDVDQIYLADPGTLFDLELGDHGFLAVAPEDSSVMLIDCARMAELWSRESAASGKKTDLLAAAADRYGALEGRWNARDGEYRPDEPGVLHYTTLHTQPWRPFPERFVYQEGPHGDLWHGLEREADRARFGVFTRAQPSRAALELLEAGPDPALEDLPDEDVPWALDERFAVAERRLDIEVRGDPDRDAAWWSGRLRAASARHPEVGWELSVRDGRGAPALRTGGRHLGPEPPRVWVLTDDRPGNSTQSLGLAEALGWNTEEKRLCLGALSALSNRALGAARRGVQRSASEPLEPPWPDLVIGAGRRTAPVALWIRKQSRGRTRLVQLGRKGGDAADLFDLSVVPVYAGLFPHPQRISTHLPLHRLSDTRLAQAAAEWRERLERGKAPRIGLLVGGTSGEFRFDGLRDLEPTQRRRPDPRARRGARRRGSGARVVSRRRRGQPLSGAPRPGRCLRHHGGQRVDARGGAEPGPPRLHLPDARAGDLPRDALLPRPRVGARACTSGGSPRHSPPSAGARVLVRTRHRPRLGAPHARSHPAPRAADP
jgi:hypothetical protein